MPDCTRAIPSNHAAWQASLRLRFENDGGATRLTDRSHSGPLRVQKPLYPEGAAICHAIVIHPPGGVVGGDRLAIDLQAKAGAHAFITSPGAAKWYRANGKSSLQQIRIDGASGASVEWMPQESIFFNEADVTLEHSVELAGDACYIGCDILCLGRSASGERFERGAIRQRSSIRRGGKLLWWEHGALHGGAEPMQSVFGLGGATVCATLVAVGPPSPATLLAELRAIDPALAVSQLKQVLVARYLNHDSETARRVMTRAWQILRPHLLGVAAQVPRIWNT